MEVEAEFETGAKMLLSVTLVGVFVIFLHLFESLLLKPERPRSKLRKQGIDGPSPSFLLGNFPEIKSIKTLNLLPKNTDNDAAVSSASKSISHDWLFNLFPHLKHWRNRYGPMFVYSSGTIQIACVADVETVKEIGLFTSLRLGKPAHLSKDRGPLLGQGIFASNGPNWVHQRKIIAPQLYLDKVKGMTSLMVESANSMLRLWESKVENEGGLGYAEIKVDGDLRALSADIISKACFGSNYSKGKEIFFKLRALQVIMSEGSIGIPGFRYIPTQNNRAMWKLEKEIGSMILKVVKERIERSSHEQDLLQMILEGARSLGKDDKLLNLSRDRFIVDNCKSIYFAGHETTATTATWCLMLLASHPDWQARARAEVLQCCQDRPIDAHTIRNMKTLTMVIQETLRLYSPGVFIVRQAIEDIELKGITVPKGMEIYIPVQMLHQDLHLWGPDAHSFDPQRFGNGVLGACKIPQAYLPFGVGSRVCAGQHFAMTELKVILSLILSRFELSLSPTYQHSPAFRLVVEPEHGVILHVRKL